MLDVNQRPEAQFVSHVKASLTLTMKALYAAVQEEDQAGGSNSP